MKLVFLHRQKDLIKAFKIYAEFTRVKANVVNFLCHWEELPEGVVQAFVRRWKGKEKNVLQAIAADYRPWEDGEVVLALFPNRKVLAGLPEPYSRVTYTFKGLDKVYVSLFFVDGRLPYRLLIHELFHANDLLAGRLGSVSPDRHRLIEKRSRELEKELFSNWNVNR